MIVIIFVWCSGLSLWISSCGGHDVHPEVGRIDRTRHGVTREHSDGLSWLLLVLSGRGTMEVDMPEVGFDNFAEIFLEMALHKYKLHTKTTKQIHG